MRDRLDMWGGKEEGARLRGQAAVLADMKPKQVRGKQRYVA